MAVPDTDDTNSSNSSSPQGARPSWEAAPRPAAAPRSASAPWPAAPRPAETSSAPPASGAPPSASPYYAAPQAAPSAYTPAPTASEVSAYDPDVRYDLAGNAIPSSGPSAASPVIAAPFGYSAGTTASGGAWPPPVAGGQPQYGGSQYGAQAYRNNSGEQSHLPPELEKLHWHWGAFFFPILWTKKHGLTTVAAMLTGGLIFLRVLRYIAAAISPTVFLGICVLYGLAYFGLQVFCGFNGHKIGWRNRHFPGGVEEYFKVQSAWMWWGFGVNVLLGPILAFGVFAAIASTLVGTTHHQYQPYSNRGGTSGYSRPGTYGNSSYGNSSYGNSSYGSGSTNYDSGSSTGQ